MKKSLIALAVAGSFAAPAAFAATANVDVYGIMNIGIEDKSTRSNEGEGLNVVDNFSRIGFKGSEDLGGGLKALWQIESQLSAGGADGVGGTQSLAGRNTFIGLSGGFGTVLAGRHDTPYKIATLKYDIFADTIGDYNLGRLDGVSLIDNAHDARSPNAIAYISPNWSGFTVAAAIVSTNNEAAGLDSDEQMDAISLALMYANGPLTVDVAYQDVNQVNSTAWKIGAGYTFGDLKLGFVYEDVSDRVVEVGDTDQVYTAACKNAGQKLSKGCGLDRDSWLVNAAYNMGAITLKAMYGQADVDQMVGGVKKTLDQDLWSVGADYALSKRTTAYVAYGNGDDDVASNTAGNIDDQSGWTVGMRHSF